jgi:hypothetical protein
MPASVADNVKDAEWRRIAAYPVTTLTYTEAMQFPYGLGLFGARFGLETTRTLAARAGNPQDQLRLIHVAGSNGNIRHSRCRAVGRLGCICLTFDEPPSTHRSTDLYPDVAAG